VTLCMSKWSEALAFSTSFLGSFSFSGIKRSRFSGWSHLICTSEGKVWGEGGPHALRDTFEKHMSTTGRSSSEVMEGGHLIAQEQPDTLGKCTRRGRGSKRTWLVVSRLLTSCTLLIARCPGSRGDHTLHAGPTRCFQSEAVIECIPFDSLECLL
jgi:hypothetical protein